KYRGTPFPEASCPAAHSQQKASEVPSLSPDPWPKLQPPAASPAYQRERAHTPYPLSLQKAALLYHPPALPAEAQPGALPAAYKGFGFAGCEEPFSSSYLKPQSPRSYFPSPLDPYVARAAGTGTMPQAAALPRDTEPPRRAGYLPSPGFDFGPGSTETGCERPKAESPQRQAGRRHSSAFQPVCAPEKVPGDAGGLAETLPEGEGGWVKPSHGEQETSYPGRRRTSPAPRETPHGEAPALIIIGKGDACKVKDAAKELIPSSPSTSSPEGLKDAKDGEVSPSSPPMPVINNVFSLAPYQDYLEGTEGSAQVPFCREHLQGDAPAHSTGYSQEPAALRDISGSTVQSQGERCYRKVPEKPKLLPQDSGSQQSGPAGAGSKEPAPEDVVLDLSLKKRLVKAMETQGATSRAEGMPEGEDIEEEKEGPGGRAVAGEGAKPQVLPLLLEVGSGDKSNFQSSATFMFKKFKILRSLP
ncbi:PREDICTED: uncharacterized protein C15orf39 homolog, partial [Merops nubicus]|uniref:uncharacterized protein C15orf39 homolog n=1 Tax=Merops nubicus TaxID=57421 RepID=UPI0004F010DA